MKKTIFLFLSTLSITFLFTECKKKREEEITPESTFDKKGMLANIGGNLIIPAYAELKISIDSLQYFNNLFTANPTSITLADLQGRFLAAYSSYQKVSVFEFGPGDVELVRANFNTFPCDTTQINNKIAAGDFNLSTVADIDAKGFPAIDFLLYSNSGLYKFTTHINAANAKTYLSTLINELKTKTDNVYNGWTTYISSFEGNTESNVGSPIGMLVNQLNFDLEILKNAKIGIPLGKKSLGTPFPDKTEAFYSTQSLLLAMGHLKAIENIYLGRNKQGSDGLGFDDYVAHVEAQHPLGPLNDVIKNKFISAKAKLAAIPETLSQNVLANAGLVDAAHTELQQLVVLLKVDMTSALGVAITYQDNDGD